jgi:hypothetical protein
MAQKVPRPYSKKDLKRIWPADGYRVFLSHKATAKTGVVALAERLADLGVSCFVAHKDIRPTRAWQDEIEIALQSMEAFVAFMTEDFHDSAWTDQEVGFALARAVPIVALKRGLDPYGFIGRFQALSCGEDEAPVRIVKLLVQRPRMLNCYIEAVRGCRSWNHGNTLAEVLPAIDKLARRQIQALLGAFVENEEVRGSFGFNGSRPAAYGRGLGAHLTRITGRRYTLDPVGRTITVTRL